MAIFVYLNGNVASECKLLHEEVVEKVIAVDGGLNKIPKDIKAEKLIGDLDSVEVDYQGIDVLKFPKKKDKSDFELTLDYLTDNYFNKKIIMYGLTGGRIDHQLFNFFVLKDHVKFNNYIGETDKELIYFTKVKISLAGFKGKTFSVFPMTPMKNLNIFGGKYPLNKKNCNMYSSLTLSNVIEEEELIVDFDEGVAAVIISK